MSRKKKHNSHNYEALVYNTSSDTEELEPIQEDSVHEVDQLCLKEQAPMTPELDTDKYLDLAVLTNNVNIMPRLHVAILSNSSGTSTGASQAAVDELKVYLSRFKIPYKQFSDSFANPALAHMLRLSCIAVVVSGDAETERKVLASGRFVLRLSGKESECPYVKNLNYKNLTHTIIASQDQLRRRGVPQLIAKYAVTGQAI